MQKNLYVETIGQGNPLVLLHGWGWHSAIWKSLLPKLIDNFNVFLIDLPGFGKSKYIQPYTIEHIAHELLAVTPAKATWLGWSLGGMIAWWIAIHFPERVSKLITIAASPKFVADNTWPGVSTATLDKFSQRIVSDHQSTLSDFLDLQLRGSQCSATLRADLEHDFLQNSSVDSHAGLVGGLDILRTLDLRNDLGKLRCPSLHLFGSNDMLVPKEVATLLQPQLVNGHCEVIKRAGHIPFLTHSYMFLNLLNR